MAQLVFVFSWIEQLAELGGRVDKGEYVGYGVNLGHVDGRN